MSVFFVCAWDCIDVVEDCIDCFVLWRGGGGGKMVVWVGVDERRGLMCLRFVVVVFVYFLFAV